MKFIACLKKHPYVLLGIILGIRITLFISGSLGGYLCSSAPNTPHPITQRVYFAFFHLTWISALILPFALCLALPKWLRAEKMLLILLTEGITWFTTIAIYYHFSNEQCPMGWLIPFHAILASYFIQFPLLVLFHRLLPNENPTRPRWWKVVNLLLTLTPLLALLTLFFA